MILHNWHFNSAAWVEDCKKLSIYQALKMFAVDIIQLVPWVIQISVFCSHMSEVRWLQELIHLWMWGIIHESWDDCGNSGGKRGQGSSCGSRCALCGHGWPDWLQFSCWRIHAVGPKRKRSVGGAVNIIIMLEILVVMFWGSTWGAWRTHCLFVTKAVDVRPKGEFGVTLNINANHSEGKETLSIFIYKRYKLRSCLVCCHSFIHLLSLLSFTNPVTSYSNEIILISTTSVPVSYSDESLSLTY